MRLVACITVLLIGYAVSLYSQNLITNPYFNDYTECPLLEGQIDRAIGWTTPTWSSDFYHTCGSPSYSPPNTGFGYKIPKEGSGFGGINVFSSFNSEPYREYLTSMLDQPLDKDSFYLLTFYVSPFAEDETYAVIAELGAHFSDTIYWVPKPPFPPTPVAPFYHATPQIVNPSYRILSDSSSWAPICGFYQARGGERYITFGNFFPDDQTTVLNISGWSGEPRAYYAIDDVSLVKVPRHEILLDLPSDLYVCSGDFPLEFSAQEGYDSYHWSTGDTTIQASIPSEGVYVVRAYQGECFIEDTMRVHQQLPGEFELPDLTLCPKELPVAVSLPEGYYEPIWPDGSTSETAWLPIGSHTVQAQGACGTETHTFQISYTDTLPYEFQLPADTFLCKHSTLTLQVPGLFPLVWWSTGETSQAIEISSPGLYWVEAENDCILKRDSILLVPDSIPNLRLELGPDIVNCEDDRLYPVRLEPVDELPNYYWSTGAQGRVLVVEEPGIYWLESRFRCGNLRDSIELLGCPPNPEYQIFMPNVFSPNNDGFNDLFEVFGRNITFVRLRIFDRWGNLVFETQSPEQGWDGRFRGQNMPTGVYTCLLEYLRPVTQEPAVATGDVLLLR
jgi:gliding motility-associated-like protein